MPPFSNHHVSPGPTAGHFDVDAAARYIGVSKSFLNKARLSGSGPAFLKLGRLVVYRQADIDAWLDSRRRHSTSEAAA